MTSPDNSTGDEPTLTQPVEELRLATEVLTGDATNPIAWDRIEDMLATARPGQLNTPSPAAAQL